MYTDKATNLIEQIEQLLQLEHTQERYKIMVSLFEQAKESTELVKQINIPEETVRAFNILLDWSQMKFSREL